MLKKIIFGASSVIRDCQAMLVMVFKIFFHQINYQLLQIVKIT